MYLNVATQAIETPFSLRIGLPIYFSFIDLNACRLQNVCAGKWVAPFETASQDFLYVLSMLPWNNRPISFPHFPSEY
jgi:hypothetical protein